MGVFSLFYRISMEGDSPNTANEEMEAALVPEENNEKELQPLDPGLIDKVQKTAENLGKELDDLLSSVSNSLYSISAFSSGNMNVYKEASDDLGDTVSTSVAGMYEFIKKVKQLNDDLNGVDVIHEEIKEIQKTLDILEVLSAKLISKSN